jgi:group I intron endonuclease
MNRPNELNNCSRKPIAGIYQIRNKVNGNIYIGSSNHLYRRYADHLKYLNRNNHSNPKLQNSWNRYGEGNFEFSILEYCNVVDLVVREQWYIDNINPQFNIAKVVGTPNTPKAGTVEAMERSKKNLEARKKSAWCNSEELHQIMSNLMKGRWNDLVYKESRSVETKDLWNNSEYREKQKHAHRKIDETNRIRIREMKAQGYKISEIVVAYQVSRATIDRILRGQH